MSLHATEINTLRYCSLQKYYWLVVR